MSARGSKSVRRAALAEELWESVPQPLDALELAAVIESMGITDPVAQEDYGEKSAFTLAERVFPLVLAANAPGLRQDHETSDPHTDARTGQTAATLDASARGLLALAPLALIVAALQGLAAAGWSTASLLALGLGATTAMLVTSGPVLAIGRRVAIYLGFGYRGAARRFLVVATLTTVLATGLLAAALLAASSALGLFAAPQRLIFSASIAGYALLWLLVAGLVQSGVGLSAAVACLVGPVAGFAVGFQAGSTAGLGACYAATVAALVAAWVVTYPRDPARSLRLPPVGRTLLEAAPYAAFGSAAALLLLEPHVLGWLGGSARGRLRTLTTLELSLMLALPPLLLATGVMERMTRSFWKFARERRRLDSALQFRLALTAFHRRNVRRYAATLGCLSLAAAVGFELALQAGLLDAASRSVFLFGLAAFFGLGIGQFNCLFMLSLAVPKRALRPVVAGIVVVSLVGTPLSLVDFRYSALAFALAGAAFATATTRSCRTVLGEADYHYATAF